MADIWYYSQNDQEHGPVEAAELRRLVEAGTITSSVLVRTEEMSEWLPANTVDGLLAAEVVLTEELPEVLPVEKRPREVREQSRQQYPPPLPRQRPARRPFVFLGTLIAVLLLLGQFGVLGYFCVVDVRKAWTPLPSPGVATITVGKPVRASLSLGGEYNADVYLNAAQTFQFELSSKDFDAGFGLEENGRGCVRAMESNVWSGPAHTTYRPNRAGVYRITVEHYNGPSGTFELLVKKKEPPKLLLHASGDRTVGTVSAPLPFGATEEYAVDLKKGKVYSIDLKTTAFNGYLQVFDPSGVPIANSPNVSREANLPPGGSMPLPSGSIGSNSSAHLGILPTRTGTYRVVVGGRDNSSGGRYELSVETIRPQTITLSKDQEASMAGIIPTTGVKQYKLHLEAKTEYVFNIESLPSYATLDLFHDGMSGKQKPLGKLTRSGNNASLVYQTTAAGNYLLLVAFPNPRRWARFKLDIQKIGSKKLTLSKEGNGSVRDYVAAHATREYTVPLHKDRMYVIDLKSSAFVCYLELFHTTTYPLMTNDDGGGGTNARIQFQPTVSGDYRIVAQSLGRRGGGPFQLTVRSWRKKILSLAGHSSVQQEDTLGKATSERYHIHLYAYKTYLFEVESDSFAPAIRLYLPSNPGASLRKATASETGRPATFFFHPTRSTEYVLEVENPLVAPTGKVRITVRQLDLHQLGGQESPLRRTHGNIAAGASADYAVWLHENTTYTLVLKSTEFVPHLMLYDHATGQKLAWCKNAKGKTARLTFRPYRTTQGLISVWTGNSAKGGKFTLDVLRSNAEQKSSPGDVVKTFNGKLRPGATRTYDVSLKANTTYSIAMTSKILDGSLDVFFDSGTARIAYDDNGGEGKNPRILFRPITSGTYRIAAHAAPGEEGKNADGDFTLTVRRHADR